MSDVDRGMQRAAWIVATLALVSVLIWALGPEVRSLILQERSGRHVDRALALEGRLEGDPWRLLQPVTQPEARAALAEARPLMQQAAAVDATHAQPRRWLGRIGLLMDDPAAAVLPLATYVRLKPENPLGYWELGLAQERLAERVAAATAWQLALDPDGDGRAAVRPRGDHVVTDTVASAQVETPDIVIETPLCEPGGPASTCFVGRDQWLAPPSVPPGMAPMTRTAQTGVLFMHPPARAAWQVTVPESAPTLLFWLGLDPKVATHWGDGVTFRVSVDGEVAFERHLTPEEAGRGWQPDTVSLAAWRGETVNLALSTDAGPANDGSGDWAGWAEVRLIAGLDLSGLEGLVAFPPWLWWARGGFTAGQFYALGREALDRSAESEASAWFRRAVQMDPAIWPRVSDHLLDEGPE